MLKRLINSVKARKAAIMLIWGIIIIFCALNTDKVTAEGIAGITPKAADDPNSPEFIISLAAQGVITVFSIVYGARKIRAGKKEG